MNRLTVSTIFRATTQLLNQLTLLFAELLSQLKNCHAYYFTIETVLMTIRICGWGLTDRRADIATYRAVIAARNERIMTFETCDFRKLLNNILLCKLILSKLVVTDRNT